MVQKMLSTIVILGAASLAQANDSAFAKIEVKGIDPGPLKIGQSVEFYGKNADDFFAMLPPVVVARTEDEQSKEAAKHRFLAIQSKGYSLNISCSKTQWDENSGEEIPNVKGTVCAITMSYPDTDGDSFRHKPAVCK